MKVSLFFFDRYTSESLWIAMAVWPLYFIVFYLFCNDGKDILNRSILIPLIGSLIVSSFSALVFADTLVEYMVFFLGFGILVFGAMAKVKPNKKSVIIFLLGIFISLLAGLVVYAMRTKIYNRISIPNTKGYINYTDTSYWLWIVIQLIMYIYILYYMYTH
jgi:hypothetical protein